MYANFHSVEANDFCGYIGSEPIITQTMLTFSPGELSTIAGPLTDLGNPMKASDVEGATIISFSSEAFDFADLPCPPKSVMVSVVIGLH